MTESVVTGSTRGMVRAHYNRVGQPDMVKEYETLRWPTNLDRAGIEKRLVQVRDAGVPELAAKFAALEKMTAAQLGAAVVSALGWIQDKPEHRAIATQLEMVAMNLKNLKGSG